MNLINNKELHTDNWFNFASFYKTIAARNYKVLVEVGVWKGHSVTFLANEIRKNGMEAKLYAVDLWDGSNVGADLDTDISNIYNIYNEYKKQYGVGVADMITDLKGVSWEMADNFEDGTVDFVFIDADHEYESVVKDINAWLPKVRTGGIISGHDHGAGAGVEQAEDELVPDRRLTTGTVWYTKVK